MPKQRRLDTVNFSIMRDGEHVDVCWTDLIWEDRVSFMRSNNNEGWLIQMIQTMNNVAWQIQEAYPERPIKQVCLLQGRKLSLTWLRNSLIRLTADIRLAAEELNISIEDD